MLIRMGSGNARQCYGRSQTESECGACIVSKLVCEPIGVCNKTGVTLTSIMVRASAVTQCAELHCVYDISVTMLV